jgi:hypothetical protein
MVGDAPKLSVALPCRAWRFTVHGLTSPVQSRSGGAKDHVRSSQRPEQAVGPDVGGNPTFQRLQLLLLLRSEALHQRDASRKSRRLPDAITGHGDAEGVGDHPERYKGDDGDRESAEVEAEREPQHRPQVDLVDGVAEAALPARRDGLGPALGAGSRGDLRLGAYNWTRGVAQWPGEKAGGHSA